MKYYVTYAKEVDDVAVIDSRPHPLECDRATIASMLGNLALRCEYVRAENQKWIGKEIVHTELGTQTTWHYLTAKPITEGGSHGAASKTV